MDFVLINKFFILIINFLSLWLATFVFRQNKNRSLKKIFLIMIPAILIWVDFAFLARFIGVDNVSLSEMLLKIAWFVTPIVFYSLYLFIINIFDLKDDFKVSTYFLLIVTIIASLSTVFTNKVIVGFQDIGNDFTII